MRARTTWNREQIKQASAKTAEDPRAMNQDHHSQQPKADAYVNGDPSSWAEDIHKPNEWEKEYSGGATKRDEIGMPEKRPETYNHPEKTAANMDEKLLTKKADFTVKLAKLMLGNEAPEAKVEDQAVALMHMPDDALITTYNTLSEKLANQSQFPGGQFPTAEQQQVSQQQQVAQLQQQAQQALQSGDFEQAKQAIEQCMAQQQGKQQQVMAGQRKADTGMTPAPASAAPSAPAAGSVQNQAPAPAPAAPAPVATPDLQQVVMAAVNAALKQAGVIRANDQQQGQGQGQQQQGQQTQANQQMPQQMQTQAEQQAQLAQQQMQQQMQADDALLDELMMGPGQDGISEADIELEPAPMDVGEVQLGPEDDVLKTLFANEETQAAEQAQQMQQGGEQQKQAGMARTASTRTVGTRPTGGVSKVGGGVAAPAARGKEIDTLAALWPSAPDVRSAFNMGS